jgi:hypothetical protein
MSQELQSVRNGSASESVSGRAFERRRERKNPASEVRRLLIAAARALPAGLPLWVNKSESERAR